MKINNRIVGLHGELYKLLHVSLVASKTPKKLYKQASTKMDDAQNLILNGVTVTGSKVENSAIAVEGNDIQDQVLPVYINRFTERLSSNFQFLQPTCI